VNFPQSSSSVQESPRKTSSTQAQMVPPSSMTTRTSKTSPVKAQASITSPRTPLPSVPTTFEGFVLIESNPTERILKYNRGLTSFHSYLLTFCTNIFTIKQSNNIF
jgi:hypothetical protein